MGTCGHTPSSESEFTAARRRLSLSPASTQTHISHIPQPLQAPGAASQLGATLDCSRPPQRNTHKPHYKHPQMERILLSPLRGSFTSIAAEAVLPPSPQSAADEVRKQRRRPRTTMFHPNVNEFLKILALSSGESINSLALLCCLKVRLTQRCRK